MQPIRHLGKVSSRDYELIVSQANKLNAIPIWHTLQRSTRRSGFYGERHAVAVGDFSVCPKCDASTLSSPPNPKAMQPSARRMQSANNLCDHTTWFMTRVVSTLRRGRPTLTTTQTLHDTLWFAHGYLVKRRPVVAVLVPLTLSYLEIGNRVTLSPP